jgi:hypothetical protein
VSADGRLALSAARFDNVVGVWEVRTGRCRAHDGGQSNTTKAEHDDGLPDLYLSVVVDHSDGGSDGAAKKRRQF